MAELNRGVFVETALVERLDLEVVFEFELLVGAVEIVGTEPVVSLVVVKPVVRVVLT